MNTAVEAYLTFLETALLVIQPVLLFLVLYSWHFAWRVDRDWRRGGREEPRPRVAVALAFAKTLSFLCSSILVWGIIFRLRVGMPVPDWFIPLQGTATFGLIVTSFVTIAYIFFVDVTNRWRK